MQPPMLHPTEAAGGLGGASCLTPTKPLSSSSSSSSNTGSSSNLPSSPVCTTASLSEETSLPTSPTSSTASSSLPSSAGPGASSLHPVEEAAAEMARLLHGDAAAGSSPSSPFLLDGHDGEGGGGRPSPARPRKIYGRLPKFSPFLGNFQHAPSAGNRSRASFFEKLLMTEEEHERRRRIKTNPFTGTFHFFPGRYSNLHGLQRFRERHQQAVGGSFMTTSFDELDRLAALGRAVSKKVKEADNPAFAAVFMDGVFSVSPVQQTQRRSFYPHKTKSGQAWYAELTMTNGLPRHRYGGAVDTSRKFGSSLDDCCLTALKTTLTAPSLYREILYRWNGFRLHFYKRMRPSARARPLGLGHGGGSMDMSFGMTRRASATWRRDSATSLAGLVGEGGRGGGGGGGGGGDRGGHHQRHLSHSHSSMSMSRTHSTGHMVLPYLVDEGGGGGGGGGGYRIVKTNKGGGSRSPPTPRAADSGGGGGGGGGGESDYTMGHEYYHPPSPRADEAMIGRLRRASIHPPPAGSVLRQASAPVLGGGEGGRGGEVALVPPTLLQASPKGSLPPKHPSTAVAAHRAPAAAARGGGGGGGQEDVALSKRKVGDKYDVDQAEILGTSLPFYPPTHPPTHLPIHLLFSFSHHQPIHPPTSLSLSPNPPTHPPTHPNKGEGSYAAVYGGIHRESQERVAVKAIKRR